MHGYNYAVFGDNLWETVSISLLTEGNAGEFFLNIINTYLFICLRMWFYIFSILTKLFNNKAGMQRGEGGG